MKNLFKNRKLLTLLIALATLGSFALSNIAATTAGITVTSTPQFLAITISPSAYNFTGTNGTGSGGTAARVWFLTTSIIPILTAIRPLPPGPALLPANATSPSPILLASLQT